MRTLRSAKAPSSPAMNEVESNKTPIQKKTRIRSDGNFAAGSKSSPLAAITRDLTPPVRRRAVSARPERVPKTPIEFEPEHEHHDALMQEESCSMQQSPSLSRSKRGPLAGRTNSAPEITTDQDNSPSRLRSRRTKSDPSPTEKTGSTQKSEAEVDRGIQNILNKPHVSKGGSYNYIFSVKNSADGRDLLKVGWSVDTEQRQSGLRSRCKYTKTEELTVGISSRMKFAYTAERLMLAELENFKWQGTCCCNQQHQELFEPQHQDIVVAAFKRWSTFCQSDPWDEEGNLKSLWQKRLQEIGPYNTVEESAYDPNRVAQRWETFIDVPSWYRLQHDVVTIAEVIKPLRWQTLALLQAIVIAFLTFPSIYSFWWVCFLTLCQLVESMGMEELYSKDLITKLLQQPLQASPTKKGPALDASVSTPITTRGANDSAAGVGNWPHGDSGTEDKSQDELPNFLDEEMHDLAEEDEDSQEDEYSEEDENIAARRLPSRSPQIPARDIPRQSVESDETDPEVTLPKLPLPGSKESPFELSD